MSAFQVGAPHIASLVAFALRNGDRPGEFTFYHDGPHRCQARELSDILALENVRSLRSRYSSADEVAIDFLAVHPLLERAADFSMVQVLKAISCFEYQSCESSDWATTEAHSLIAALRETAIRKLDGYASAKWEIGEVDLAKPAAPRSNSGAFARR